MAHLREPARLCLGQHSAQQMRRSSHGCSYIRRAQQQKCPHTMHDSLREKQERKHLRLRYADRAPMGALGAASREEVSRRLAPPGPIMPLEGAAAMALPMPARPGGPLPPAPA